MAQTAETNGSAKSQVETILVVEDGESVRKMICTMLIQIGYCCVEASGGEEALELLRRMRNVCLVLTDITMPGMNGAELARHISLQYPDIRIVFMSGYSDDPVIRTVDGASGLFLAKPFTASTLADRIRQSLDRPWSGLPEPCSNA